MPAGEDENGTTYGIARIRRLGPREIRSKRFTARRFGRRGLDPGEVRQFLVRVAGEVAALRAELAGAREEGSQVRRALRDWHAWYAARQRPTEPRPVTRESGAAPPNQSQRHRRQG